ncbi:hypothetical protein FRX31_004779 [Thalictrum thalictroides]|uniref:Uncharacterized protein n=1 Tax=Thalictrum thalictroides TaxID=46969 RepID=A0A7J6X783_THATH|nr:hypothetical protein FRX31_004779 [Thalictrum thalictroides]
MESSEEGINGVVDTSDQRDTSRNRSKRWVFGRKLRKVKKVVVFRFRKFQKNNSFSSSSQPQSVAWLGVYMGKLAPLYGSESIWEAATFLL